MTDKDLKKLSRTELLEILIEQTRRADALAQELEAARAQLAARELAVSEAGSIADAALRLNGIFEAAQAAADQYLENVRERSANQEELLNAREEECRRRTEEIMREADEYCLAREREADAYWDDISKRLERFYDEHVGLRELLSTNTRRRGDE